MLLYRSTISLIAPLLAGALALRTLRGKEPGDAFAERLGHCPKAGRANIWVHGASNGELESARPLIEALRAARPDLEITVTTNTVSARKMVRGWNLAQVSAFCAPLDLRGPTKRLLASRRVVALLSLENELWPNRLVATAAQGIPVCLVAAKVSRKSAKIWKRLPSLRKEMFQSLSFLAPQDRGSRNRFLALGVGADQMAPVIELKSLYQADRIDPPALNRPRSQIWLAASTHQGEEDIMLNALDALRQKGEAPLLILAPRHPKRASEIVAILQNKGFRFAQRSLGEQPDQSTEIYLADTMGEMPMWYTSAGVTFVAGSFADKGGHTPFEPAAYKTAILHGPSTSNFRRIYRDLDAAGGAVLVNAPSDLADAVACALEDPNRLTERATATIQKTTDLSPVVDRILRALPVPGSR
ncbi:3-deoxy-D-manno-octulosonic acid transferase [Donghicola sp. XS_ASV15]|uniref:3-deoxy-D-manno-octulosonic acid transferase n=1 Tax=Donghicola sp. XS_ASV15 TaxID=3241295 RepID=UPI003516701B